MTPGAEAEVRRWMKQVLGYIRSLTWAMWSEHELSCSIEVNNVRIGGQDSVCNNPSLFIYTHSGLDKDCLCLQCAMRGRDPVKNKSVKNSARSKNNKK